MVFQNGHPCYLKKHTKETKKKISQTKKKNREQISAKSKEMWKTRSKDTIKNWVEGRKETRFKKGQTPWNKGIPMSEEQKKKVSLSKKGSVPWNKGLTKKTNSTVRKISLSKIGKPHPCTEETKLKISKANRNNPKINRSRKGKTYREFYGKERTDQYKKKLRELTIRMIEKNKFDGMPLYPMVGKKEKQILDALEKSFGYTVLRQHKVAGYFLDGYCPALNLAIEIDESHHRKESQIKRDIYRSDIIKKELGCIITRIPVEC